MKVSPTLSSLFLWAALLVFAVGYIILALGCVAVATGVLAAWDVGTSVVGIGQRNQQQDVLEQQVAELQGLRDDIRRAGIVRDPQLSSSEAAREREIKDRFQPPTVRERSLWERIRRMLP